MRCSSSSAQLTVAATRCFSTIQHTENDTAEAMVKALADIEGVERVDQVALTSAGQPPGLPMGFLAGRDGRAPSGRSSGLEPEHPDEQHALRVRLYFTGDAARLIGPATHVLTVRGASLLALASVSRASRTSSFISPDGTFDDHDRRWRLAGRGSGPTQ
jgi:hypothetical protein